MKRKQQAKENGKSFKMLFIYCSVVLFFILISVGIKIFYVFKASKFDGQHRFTIAVEDQKKQSEILSMDKGSNFLQRVSITGNSDIRTIGKVLGIGIDGRIFYPSSLQINQPISKQLMTFALSPGLHADLTIFDILNMAIVAQKIGGGKTQVLSVKLPEDVNNLPDNFVTQFSDDGIESENISIQIVNATGVSGLGMRCERIINSLGGNVIDIATAQDISNTSRIIYYGQSSYTLRKLTELFHFPIQQVNIKQIADIIIILGKNSLRSEAF